MQPVLVLGIGNILLRDEGVGVRVVDALGDYVLPDDVEVADGGTAGADLVELLADRRKVIVVDAVEAGAAPGTILRLTPADLLPEPGELISLHQLGLAESLHMTAQLQCSPQEVIIIAVQPATISPGLELSAAVEAQLPAVVRAVIAELGSGHDGSARSPGGPAIVPRRTATAGQ
jgi:hydrogenase maturation protease